jgi:hypothetical protein
MLLLGDFWCLRLFCPIFGANVTFERFLMPLNPKLLSDEHLSAIFDGIFLSLK